MRLNEWRYSINWVYMCFLSSFEIIGRIEIGWKLFGLEVCLDLWIGVICVSLKDRRVNIRLDIII